jgi:hypothetical protein
MKTNKFMKLSLKNVFLSVGIFAFVLALVGAVSTSKAEAYARVASVSGAWGDTATWGGNSVPVAGDTVTINAAITVNVDTTAAATSITFVDPAAGANGLTFTGTNTLTVSGAITVPLSSGAGTTTIAVGTGFLTAGSVSITGGASGVGSMTVSTGHITTTGDFSLLGASGIGKALLTSTGGSVILIGGNFVNTLGTVTNVGTMTITGNLTGAGTVINSTNGILNLNGATNTVTTLTATAVPNTVNYGGGVQTVKDTATHTYNNLTLSGTGAKDLTGITTISGNFSMSGSATATPAFTGNIAGSASISGTAVMTTGANMTVGTTLLVDTGSTLHLGGFTLGVGTTTTINGTLDTTNATSTKTFTGLVTVGPVGVLNLSGFNPVTAFGAGITNNSATLANLGSGASTLVGDIGGTGSITWGGALTISSGTTTNSNTGTVTVTGTLTLTGNWTQGANSTLDLKAAGALGGAGVLTTTLANIVSYSGGVQTIYTPAAGYYNLTLSGTGAKTFPAATVVNNNLAINGAGTATVTLSGNSNTANALYFDTSFQRPGTWGSSGSTLPAARQSNTYFTTAATGSITVATGSGGGYTPVTCGYPATLVNGVCVLPSSSSSGGGSSYVVTTVTCTAPQVLNTSTNTCVTLVTSAAVSCPTGQVFSKTTGEKCTTFTSEEVSEVPAYNFGSVTLRNGSRGDAVKELQRFLNNKLNLGLIIDGKLGPKTIAVIKQWQKAHGLVGDGLVGPKTKAMMLAQ